MKKFLIISAIAALTTTAPAMAGSASAAGLPQYFNSENGPVAVFPQGATKAAPGSTGPMLEYYHGENGPAAVLPSGSAPRH